MCGTFWKLAAWLLLVGCAKMAVMDSADEIFERNHNSTLSDDDTAEETQHTFCKIATEELQATANATITRQLKGVCTSRELKRAMGAIMREIQTLKDALIGSASAHAHSESKRNKRKNLLELFAISNRGATATEENLLIPMNNGEVNGRYTYYWTITDVEQYLHEGISLKSPCITFQDIKYYLRLTIVDRRVTIHMAAQDEHQTNVQLNYTIFVLGTSGKSKNGVKDLRDLRLDASNAYSAPLRRLRALKRDTDAIFIKLIIE